MNGGPARGVIIAAPASGCGKTLITLGLLRHLSRAGQPVASAKAGPDYIDPAFHTAASGRPCLNMDVWAMRAETLTTISDELAQNGGTVICEGVMGLFDGATARPADGNGSTAELARIIGWPVVLIVDARAQAASAAALVRGFASHAAEVTISGVVFNRVGGDRHAGLLKDAMADSLPHIPVLGCLPGRGDLELPERHLGLVQAGEHDDLEDFLDRAAAWIDAHVDITTLITLARPARGVEMAANPPPLSPLGQRIAVACDDAFAFCYPHVLNGWQQAGAEVLTFSPLAGEGPDADADAVYLPGGYPELHAGRLSSSDALMAGLRAAAGRGAAVFGECGGYMMMGDALTDANGVRHAMAGLLAVETSFAERRLYLGYRRVELLGDGPLGAAGTIYRGHEFHYATIVAEGPGEPLFQSTNASGCDNGTTGLRLGTVSGSFIHLIDTESPT